MTQLIRRTGAAPLAPSAAPRLLPPGGAWTAVAFGFIAWGIFPERADGPGKPAARTLIAAEDAIEAAVEAVGENEDKGLSPGAPALFRRGFPRPRSTNPLKGLFINIRA